MKNKYAIYIKPEDIVKLEEQDYDSLYNTCIHNGRIYIRKFYLERINICQKI